jgi:CrcB protein
LGDLLVLGVGGFLGAILRYLLSGFAQSVSRSISFPYGTLAVNVIGCFVLGILAQLVESRGLLTPQMRLFAMVGVLGAFTTFSAFGLESINLLENRETIPALLNIAANVVLCLGSVIVGKWLAFLIWR